MPLSSFTEQKVNYIASLIPIIIVTVLTACQKDERVILLPSPSIDYGRYFLYDTKCQRKRGISHDKIRFVSEEEGVTYTLTDAGGTTSLQTPLIAQTFYGNVFQRRCYHYNKKTGNCFDRDLQPVKWQHFKNSGGQLRICAQNEQYPRDSFEYVALRSAYHLQDAHRFYQESVGKSVPTMSLQILPFFRTFYQSEQISTYALRHNNIVYFPHSKTMAVLPEGENFQGKSLWDSPYVMAHEFAHHAQYYVLLQHNIGSVAFTKTQKKNKQSAEAFLEGWADLFAYYATGENPHLISTYPCFGFNRDISNHLFHDRTPKIITHRGLGLFLSGGRASNDMLTTRLHRLAYYRCCFCPPPAYHH